MEKEESQEQLLGLTQKNQELLELNAQLTQKNQELLELNNELVKLNAQKDKFFSIIAHDLRSPFNSFLGLSKMLVDDLNDFDSGEIKVIAGSLNKSADNIFQLLNNLLDWSRVKVGHTKLNLKTIFLNDIVINIVNLYRESAKAKGIILKNKIFDSIVVKYDKNMLETIIRNLVGNAIKYCREGDTILVSADRVSKELIQFSITDTGIGMSEKRLSGLFQIDSDDIKRTGTKGELSSGLGLLLCKEFVEKHGGKIWAESQEEKGSTFFFTIPTIPEN